MTHRTAATSYKAGKGRIIVVPRDRGRTESSDDLRLADAVQYAHRVGANSIAPGDYHLERALRLWE